MDWLNAALALTFAVYLAGVGHLFTVLGNMTRMDALVVTAVLAEFTKKLLYISLGVPDKALSLVLSAPLLLAAGWWMARGPVDVSPIVAPLRWLLAWFASLATFTLLNTEGSFLVLAGYLVFWLWVPAAAGLLDQAGRWTYRVLWLAVLVAVVNQVLGPDPLWQAYQALAEEVSIGARYTPATGYSGSIFSSPSELGAFSLSACALLATGARRPRALFPLSLAASLLTGSRYVLLGVIVFWIALLWGRLASLRPWQTVAAVLAYSPIQDFVGRRLLENPPELTAAANTFLARLSTVGTLDARVGFAEAWPRVFSQHWLVGIGLVDVYSPSAFYPDDRHNLILWLVLRGGILALLSYFAFVWLHFRQFEQAGRTGRVGKAFLLAALIMSMGGPQASSGWFFLTVGALFSAARAYVRA